MASEIDKISNLSSNTDFVEIQTKLVFLENDCELRKNEVSDHFRTLHEDLNRREAELLAEIDEIVRSTSAKVMRQKENLERYLKAKQDAEEIFENNQLIEILKDTIVQLQAQIDEILSDEVEVPEIELKWNLNQAQECVAYVCEISQRKHPYTYRRSTQWSLGQEGAEPGQLKSPWGLAIDPESENVYIADCVNNRVQIFDREGVYVRHINLPEPHPRYVVINGPDCYISCDNSVFRLKKENCEVICSLKVNTDIRGLDKYNDKLYVCEMDDYYVYVFTSDHLRMHEKIRLHSQHLVEDKHGLHHAYLFDIKIADDTMFILFANSNYPLQSFTLQGKLVSTISNDVFIDECFFFCIDKNRNFILTDRAVNVIKVISHDGEFLGTVGQKGTLRAQLKKPMGIALNQANRIIVCDQKVDNILQCF